MKRTGRHAVIFSVNDATDLEVVETFMRSDMIDDIPVPQAKRLYVLEDVDAMGRLVHKRKADPADTPVTTASSEAKGDSHALLGVETLSCLLPSPTVGKTDESPVVLALKAEQSRLERRNNDLSFFLNLLDGIIEAKGRIIVMTTNHVSRLDEALIRPGRMDLRVEMRRCSRATACEIVGHFYGRPPDGVDLPDAVTDFSVTPAEVSRVCRCHRRSLPQALEGLAESAAADPDGE
eukprot:Polyplicarium_translucidae@DN3164_c1_g2_i1.p1